MKKFAKWLLLSGLLAMILTGCGTNEEVKEETNGTTPIENVEQEEQNTEDQAEENVDPVKEEVTEDETIRNDEQNLQYEFNGEQKEATAKLTQSDNQNFSLYVLPEYVLTAEEPHKDVLYYTENEQSFMRIELLPADANWDTVIETAKAQLESVNAEVKTIDAPDDDFFQETTALETAKDMDVVTALLIKNEKQPIKLTIFTKSDSDNKDAYIQMAKTISTIE
ncbi:hypothetical protein J2Z40_000480 [Cytobacillus eiseniae]|uniref:Lipoprotein n=1 Tax=Cytobacillus eiseniae TaxID=762947 RepID=A0ABS4RDL0_9BACI|nr:hypothetical protein [Cytobacillus eiseniae]MBP2239927.1 hypothetical protein [Cytobacillus eiseniae]